jgi:hypothetical protein
MLFVTFTGCIWANLPELKTKQALDNIRLISNDGKYTYYQQNSGELQMATNYDNKLVIQSSKGTQYLLSSTADRKKIVAEVIKDFHKQLNFFEINDIYLIDYGATKNSFVAKGKNAKLHLKDNFLSFYNPKSKAISIKNLVTDSKPLEIKLNNIVNPYFTPEVIMPTPDTVLYTDINQQGHMAIQMYTLSDKKFSIVYKSKFPSMRLDFCKIKETIVVGEFSYDGINRGSSIVQIPLYNNQNFANLTTLYQSELPDLGHLTCLENEFYFIKATEYNEKINLTLSEAAVFDLANKTVKILTSLEYVTNIVAMDGTILIPFRNKYYVAKGDNLLNKDELIQGKKP